MRIADPPLDRFACVRHICLTMKTATVRDLRNRFPRIAAWIEQGQPVEITRAGKAFAHLLPAPPQTPRRFKMPDIMARLDQTFGRTCYDSADVAEGLASCERQDAAATIPCYDSADVAEGLAASRGDLS